MLLTENVVVTMLKIISSTIYRVVLECGKVEFLVFAGLDLTGLTNLLGLAKVRDFQTIPITDFL